MPSASGRYIVRFRMVGSILLWVVSLLAPWPVFAQSIGLVGIVEGGGTLIRQTTRYALAEGVALHEQDIVETAPGAFAQVELPGGVLVGLGESTRVMFQPRVANMPKGGLAPTPLYLLQGWLKTSTNGAFRYAGPAFELSMQGATAVVFAAGANYQVFLESGGARLVPRDAPQAFAQLAGGDFAQGREGAQPTVGRRPAPEFLARLPRQFRDRLPARGEQLARRNVAPKPIAEVSYADVSPWLQTEPGLRLPLMPLWKGRANDLNFRAAAKANLAQHPEWEPHADPEGYARRLAIEAERRRAREEARRAARAAAAAAEAARNEAGKSQ